ncbi:MAG TPA: hypothetical protein IAC37_12310 [Candidatus Ventrimonas merdavium]|nr:hypothetical protein [Candidatus Ventrimonas merdavium]
MLDQKDLELIAEIVERVTSSMKSDIKVLQGDMRSMKLTLENETNRNISIIAEGHLDLSRKLDEALKNSNERELIKLRINRLERNSSQSICMQINEGAIETQVLN